MKKTLAGASSASIRKAVNGISAAIDRKPRHTRYPSLDLQFVLNEIPKNMQKKAIEWYVRGIKRGMAAATDKMAAREIMLVGDNIEAPQEMTIKVRTKFAGEKWTQRKIKVAAEEIGFE